MTAPYTLMNRDVPVCDVMYNVDLGSIQEVGTLRNPAWAPPCALAPNGSITRAELDYWWASRFVPAIRFPRVLEQRPVFRRLFEENKGLSLADQYWLRPAGFDGSWKDINFFRNPFDEAVGRELLGTMERSSVSPDAPLLTPSAATNGALRKYWRIDARGVRQLCKAASKPVGREPINEYVASCVMELLLNPDDYVPYTVETMARESWSVCDCFTDETHEYVPVSQLFYGDPPLYGPEALDRLRAFGAAHAIAGLDEALDKMMTIDALIDNNDRHLGNFGVLRNVETLRFERAAPIFDCGSSLWARPQDRPPFAPFAQTTARQTDCIGSLEWLDEGALIRVPEVVYSALVKQGVSEQEAHAVVEAVAWRCDMLIASA